MDRRTTKHHHGPKQSRRRYGGTKGRKSASSTAGGDRGVILGTLQGHCRRVRRGGRGPRQPRRRVGIRAFFSDYSHFTERTGITFIFQEVICKKSKGKECLGP